MDLNTLDNADYRKAVLSTESKPDAVNFGPATLFVALNLAVAASVVLDQVKRAIYYGREMDQQMMLNALNTVTSLSEQLKFPVGTGRYRDQHDADFFQQLPQDIREKLNASDVNVRLLHAAIGQFTESGEFIEAILPSLLGQPVDKVNLLEEQGDSSWYGEIALDELGYTRGQSNFTNIKKLTDKKAGRYKKGAFDPNAAVERDVSKERGLLEAGAEAAVA
jgi:hypothetical protein